MIKSLLDVTAQISGSLNAQITLPFSNPKLISLFKQQTVISHTVHNADQTIRQLVDTLRNRTGILYGEDIPLDRSMLLDWCTSRLEAWGTAAGMEAFKEEREGHVTMMLGGKVIVVDIDIALDRSVMDNPSMDLSSVKTSYAVPNGAAGSTTAGSASLDGYLNDSLRAFLSEVQKDEELQDPEEAARIGARIADDFRYLMDMDQLAFREAENGLRWFNIMDLLSVEAERFAQKEAESVAGSISSTPAPLDIFLMRSHALPLPYLTSPSVSFLVYLSPLVYLSMLRISPVPSVPLSNSSLPILDVPFNHLRSRVTSHPRPPGVTIATLVFSSSKGPSLPDHPNTMNMEVLATRPTFLIAPGAQIELVFPLPIEPTGQAKRSHRWLLDFTDGGKYPGVVMSQSRMREIEMIVNPLGAGSNQFSNVPSISFGVGSWVDLLLRLAAPEEPGFFLEKIPVRNIKEVWGILEVVREQCWLNEILSACHWTPEGLKPEEHEASDEDERVTDAELEAVLHGTIAPKRLPVNVYVPTSIPAGTDDSLFDTDIDSMGLSQSNAHRATRIVMRSPEKPPYQGMVEISVEYNCARPRGVYLQIDGAIGADWDIDSLEETAEVTMGRNQWLL
ncbi:hypothetical protein EW026_g1786 [Hermanssonia centrifuga]|uniref:Mediator of RNA polymerase II transcription subunit 1 n=1 Tax=Hermanssonia centrifuga TaxID=98765 RepID=A0A4S4KS39_9APHY|nr:hypothetical protein EW026_g1786 [Hermanssonia centrifuga]